MVSGKVLAIDFNITKPTLVIVRTEDAVTPPANSLILAQKIPGAWLVQINGGGHTAMYQYPDKFKKIVKTFLAVTRHSR